MTELISNQMGNLEEYKCLANKYRQVGQFTKATQIYLEAIELCKDILKVDHSNSDVRKALVTFYYLTNSDQNCINELQKVLQYEPNDFEMNLIAGNILSYSYSQFFKSLHFYQNAFNNKEKINEELVMHYANSLQLCFKVEKAVDILKEYRQKFPSKAFYNFLIYLMHHSLDESEESISLIAKEYQALNQPKNKYNHDKKKNSKTKNKIRLGFISPYFIEKNSVEYWLKHIFQNFDRAQFEIFIYDDGSPPNPFQEQLKDTMDKYCITKSLNSKDLAELIYSDQLDIFIDLVGFIKNNRLELFSYKPAPVQVSWLNYFGTTGMQEMDYVIADKFVISEENKKHYSEKIYRLPSCWVPFIPTNPEIEVSELPCIKNQYISFGSLNRSNKINIETLHLWSQILKQVPNSKLYFIGKGLFGEELHNLTNLVFKENGINESRIKIVGALPKEEFLQTISRYIDINLDPMPFNGGTTTLEASLMGIPTITLSGDTWVHSCGESINSSIGISELISKNKEEYIKKAISLSEDIQSLSKYRSELRNKLLNSPICNHEQFTRDLETAFKFMFNEYQNSFHKCHK